MDQNLLESCVSMIKNSKHTIVLTGAGISTDSGIPDFRSDTGLYQGMPEDIFSLATLKSTPNKFFDVYDKMADAKMAAKPNAGHIALASMEKKGYVHRIITQNIDNFHQEAGSKQVIELHGTMMTNTCRKCHQHYDLAELKEDNGYEHYCTKGHKPAIIRPDIVLYDEPVLKMSEAVQEAEWTDLLIIAGTSLMVYPAAYLPYWMKLDSKIIIINYGITSLDTRYNVTAIHEGISETLSAIDGML